MILNMQSQLTKMSERVGTSKFVNGVMELVCNTSYVQSLTKTDLH